MTSLLKILMGLWWWFSLWNNFFILAITDAAFQEAQDSAPLASQELVCLDDSPSNREQDHAKQQHALWQWHTYWRKIVEVFLPSSLAWMPFSSRTSRQEEAESALTAFLDRVARRQNCDEGLGGSESRCQILQIYSSHHNPLDLCNSAGATSFAAMYELLEPLELELGDRKGKHVEDFAYSPVIHDTSKVAVEPVTDQTSPFISEGWLLSPWWNPLSWTGFSRCNNDALQIYRSRYKLNEEAFAGGSHGEVWRGRRKCFVNDDACNASEPLIFKRLKVESGGYRILEAGLREVYFGNLLRGRDTIYQRHLFTQYDTHFFGENGELWIVFKDAGSSLRSFLYTGTNSGNFIVFTHSWLWTLVRMSLAEDIHEEKKVDQIGGWEPASETMNSTNSSLAVGRELMRSFLRQVRLFNNAQAWCCSGDVQAWCCLGDGLTPAALR